MKWELMMEIIFRPFFWPLINVALGLLTALQFNDLICVHLIKICPKHFYGNQLKCECLQIKTKYCLKIYENCNFAKQNERTNAEIKVQNHWSDQKSNIKRQLHDNNWVNR